MLLGVAGSACAPEDADDGAPPAEAESAPAEAELDVATGALAGKVVVYTVRFDETGENQYFLRGRDREVRLYFDKDPGLRPGTFIRVSGKPTPTNDGLRVERFQIDEDVLGGYSQPLINGTPYKARTFAFVLVDTGAGVNITKAEAQKRLFGTAPGDRSVKQYYNEVSYGTQDITGEVVGPLMYRMTGCDTTGLARSLKTQLGMYDHYLWYLGSRTTACGWSGLAEAGLPSRPTNDSWYNGSAGCVVLVQEPGHNFGMMHSSSMTCGTAVFADDPDATCRHNEYGDRYDPMGGACNHMNAWQKVFEGWLQKCNGVTVKTSGTYTLQPLELACDGPQVLQIPMPKVRPFGRSGGGGLPTTENIGFYYLELRTARGFDDTIRSAPTILVRVAEDFRSRTDRGRHTWLLDMDPASTRTIEGLVAGKSYMDPAGGVSFTVKTISNDSATIEVTVPGTGANTCLDDTPYNAAVAPPACAGLVAPSGADGGTGIVPDSGTMTVPPPKAESLILVNADTKMDIRAVEDGAVIDLATLPPNLTIRVDTDPSVVGSVSIRIDAGMARTDAMAPYSISSDGNLSPWTLALGAHTVTATPFDNADGGGRQGEPLEIDFTLVRSGVADAGAAGMDGGTLGAGEAGLADTGIGTSVSPVTGGDGGLLGFGDAAVPPLQNKEDDGCACSVPGAQTTSSQLQRAWALAVLAIGLFVRRRSQRTRRGRA